jgi:acetyltransferase-like isoleucine patch superfamily enzyme
MKIFLEPIKAFHVGISILNGHWYKLKFFMLFKNVQIGNNFRVYGRLNIKGPGSVRIGNNVFIDGRGQPVTPYTYSKHARIMIGDNSFINGSRFGCYDRIEIGKFAIIADARILDTDFHSININRWENDAEVLHSPIEINDNVWIAAGAVILKGVHIGQNSVVGFNAVVSKEVPSNVVVAGNPAKIVKYLDNH